MVSSSLCYWKSHLSNAVQGAAEIKTTEKGDLTDKKQYNIQETNIISAPLQSKISKS